MSRNGSGTYTLPSGNPVVSGTLIEASWANTTLSDIATALTDSLSRSGQGGMTAALRLFDGTNTVPGLAWGSETTTGWYRAGAGDMRLVITGSQVIQYLSTGVAITGTLSASGNATVGGTLAVTGAMTLTANPTLSAGTANGVAYLNGSKVLTTGSALTFNGSLLGVGRTATGLRVEVDGNFGLNTAIPPGVNGSGISIYASDFPRLSFRNSTTGDTSSDGLQIYMVGNDVSYNLTESGYQAWMTGGSEQMRLTSTGLGIGTSAPTNALTVGTTSAGKNIAIYSSSNGNNGLLRMFDLGGTERLQLSANSTGEAVYYAPTGSVHAWYVNTERMRLDSSGNLGLGVTPSAWGAPTFQVGRTSVYGSGSFTAFGSNWYSDTGDKYIASDYATQYYQLNGQHVWRTAPSGTAGNAISFTQAMTLDASGNLGLGTSSPAAKLNVVTTGGKSTIAIGDTASATYSQLLLYGGSGKYNWSLGAQYNVNNAFEITPSTTVGGTTFSTPAFVIDSSGNLLVGTTSANSFQTRLNIRSAGTTVWGVGPTTSTSTFYVVNTPGTGVYLSDGATSWAAQSDERVKDIIEPITDASNKVSTLRAVIGKYKIDEEGTRRSFLIAQDVQAVLPEAVSTADDEIGTLGVQYTDVIPLLVAAIQEQQAIINQLKARLDAANL